MMGFTADVDVCTGWMNVFGEWVLPSGLSFLYLRSRLAGRFYGALAGRYDPTNYVLHIEMR